MIPFNSRLKYAAALLIGGVLVINNALADKPEWAGGGKKGGRSEHSERRDEQRGERQNGDRHEERGGPNGKHARFDEHHAAVVRDYYGEQMHGGHCPPGLAKKHNGCMPPGQAKKWEVGRRLPRDVIYYQVPPPLVTQIGPPPSGYRYVRVASDILMIAIGSGMVVDAIRDLGRS